MLKFSANPVSLISPANSDKELASKHRLIVLVPADGGYLAATRRIRELAHAAGMHIQLLGLGKDTSEESRFRRELITMASLLEDGKTSVETQIVTGPNWLEVLKINYKAGDMLVCFPEQKTGVLRRPLRQILEASFNSTVYVLSDCAPQKSSSNWLAQVSAWIGSLGIILGFGLLQAQIIQFPAEWLRNTLLILSVIPEFWLIWVWDGWYK